MTSDQLSREAGSAPSCLSVAWPENGIVWPTVQCNEGVGESMTGTGAVFPAEIVIGALLVEAPSLSVTRRTALYVPGAVYVYVGFTALESPKVPSPFRSHE